VPENPEPPQGVILRYRGRAVPCTPLRDEDLDEHGCAAWIAVPDEPVALREGEFFELTATVPLPDDSVLFPGFAVPGLGAGEETWPGSR
jgi:hypothetical protein